MVRSPYFASAVSRNHARSIVGIRQLSSSGSGAAAQVGSRREVPARVGAAHAAGRYRSGGGSGREGLAEPAGDGLAGQLQRSKPDGHLQETVGLTVHRTVPADRGPRVVLGDPTGRT